MKNNIKKFRNEMKLTQQGLADLCEVSRQTINMVENDKYDPTLQLAMKIAKVLKVKVEDIFIL